MSKGESGSLRSCEKHVRDNAPVCALFHTRFPDHFLIEGNNCPSPRPQIFNDCIAPTSAGSQPPCIQGRKGNPDTIDYRTLRSTCLSHPTISILLIPVCAFYFSFSFFLFSQCTSSPDPPLKQLTCPLSHSTSSTASKTPYARPHLIAFPSYQSHGTYHTTTHLTLLPLPLHRIGNSTGRCLFAMPRRHSHKLCSTKPAEPLRTPPSTSECRLVLDHYRIPYSLLSVFYFVGRRYFLVEGSGRTGLLGGWVGCR